MAKVRVNWGQTTDGCPVKVFVVYNTAHNGLYVLAPDREAAMSIAYTANHIHNVGFRKDTNYPHVAEEREPFSGKLADSVRRAIAQRIQGTIHLHDDYIAVGHEAIKP